MIAAEVQGDEPRAEGPPLDVIVIGAGFAGLYALYRLRAMGLKVRVFEKGADVGGVWYWNRYPGARCDCESFYYSYSFSRDLEQEWRWSERYAGEAEIRGYLSHVADRFDLRRDIAFGAAVTALVYDDVERIWTATTETGEVIRGRFVVAAAGCISAIQRPDYPGLDAFEGDVFYTAAWPHGGVDFSGKRVGVIGTGASGVQAIPHIARQAEHLTVFQRTANFVLPAHNRALADEYDAWIKANYEDIRAKCLASPGAVPFEGSGLSALAVTDAQRREIYERAWAVGGHRFFVETFFDLIVSQAANDTAADFVRGKIRQIVKDPKVAEALTPHGHPIATKRPPLSDDYYDTFNRTNVTLVDIAADPIQAFAGRALVTGQSRYDLDALVLATGFDAMTGALLRIDVRGRGGLSLRDKWAAGPETYLGLGMAGFPNLFIVTGPLSPSVFANMPTGVEQSVDWIADCLEHMRRKSLDEIEARADAEAAWVDHALEAADGTLYRGTSSWYAGSNIPGKPRRFSVYVGGFNAYRERCDAVARDGYLGFRFARERATAEMPAADV